MCYNFIFFKMSVVFTSYLHNVIFQEAILFTFKFHSEQVLAHLRKLNLWKTAILKGVRNYSPDSVNKLI